MAKEHAGNTVDCYIYAVEKSLDSYKFNLLHNKQVFINQLKSHNLATRTIDEGAMDENGGVRFSEYVPSWKRNWRSLRAKDWHTTGTRGTPKGSCTRRFQKLKKTKLS